MNFTTVFANFADHKLLGDAHNSGQLPKSISVLQPLYYSIGPQEFNSNWKYAGSDLGGLLLSELASPLKDATC